MVGRVCCTVRSALRNHKDGIAGIVSLSLNLAVNILLFSRVTFRLGCRGYCPSTSQLILMHKKKRGMGAKRGKRKCSSDLFTPVTRTFHDSLSR